MHKRTRTPFFNLLSKFSYSSLVIISYNGLANPESMEESNMSREVQLELPADDPEHDLG
jgi:hypothetical protein